MQYPTHLACLNDALSEDDVDMLFHHLDTIEPPPALVQRILALESGRADMPVASSAGSPLALESLDYWYSQRAQRTLC